MSEMTAWLILFALIVGVMLLVYGPSRSELWGAVEQWGGDNRRAALKREERRARRKAMEGTRIPDTGGER